MYVLHVFTSMPYLRYVSRNVSSSDIEFLLEGIFSRHTSFKLLF